MLSVKERQEFAETHFIPVHDIPVQPYLLLWKLRIVELGPEPVWIVVNALGADGKFPRFDRTHGRRLGERSDGREMSAKFP